jgi:hypothetical protein
MQLYFLAGVQCCKGVPKKVREGLNSLIVLIAWELWNACVFEGARLRLEVVLQAIVYESSLWCSAGALALQELLSRSLALIQLNLLFN